MNSQVMREELKNLFGRLGLLTEYANMAGRSGRAIFADAYVREMHMALGELAGIIERLGEEKA